MFRFPDTVKINPIKLVFTPWSLTLLHHHQSIQYTPIMIRSSIFKRALATQAHAQHLSQSHVPPPARTAPQTPIEEESLGQSGLLLNNPELALATPGITFTDGHGLRGRTGKGRQTRQMNLYQAIRDALGTALATDSRATVFGEDVSFGTSKP